MSSPESGKEGRFRRSKKIRFRLHPPKIKIR
jgi:hypothetical protein